MSIDSHDISRETQGDTMNADIQGKLDAIKAPFQAVIEATDALPALIDAQELVKYNEGVEAGKAMIELPDATDPNAVYTQAQMDAAVTAGKEQQASEDLVAFDIVNKELAASRAALVDASAALDTAGAKYAELVAKVKAANVDDAALLAEI